MGTIDLKLYSECVNKLIVAKKYEHVSKLVKVCVANAPNAYIIKSYYEGHEVCLTRNTFQLIEGCHNALINVLNYKCEYYNPCVNMMDDINRAVCNDPYYSRDKYRDETAYMLATQKYSLPSKMANASSVDEVLNAAAEMLAYKMYNKHNVVTVLLYVQAVLLSNFMSFIDFTQIDVTRLRHSVVDAKENNKSQFIDILKISIVSITDAMPDKQFANSESGISSAAVRAINYIGNKLEHLGADDAISAFVCKTLADCVRSKITSIDEYVNKALKDFYGSDTYNSYMSEFGYIHKHFSDYFDKEYGVSLKLGDEYDDGLKSTLSTCMQSEYADIVARIAYKYCDVDFDLAIKDIAIDLEVYFGESFGYRLYNLSKGIIRQSHT